MNTINLVQAIDALIERRINLYAIQSSRGGPIVEFRLRHANDMVKAAQQDLLAVLLELEK